MTIEGVTERGRFIWEPEDTAASVGDVIVWKNRVGDHGVRITNGADVQGHVDVETVPGQQPFNATRGRNNSSTTTPGKVLLQLKITSVPPDPIQFDCIVHGSVMSGTVSVAPTVAGLNALMRRLDMTQAMMVPSCSGGYFLIAPTQADNDRLIAVPVEPFESVDALNASERTGEGIITVRSLPGSLRWRNEFEQIEIGEEIQWVNGGGPHGLRITNWNDVRDSIEMIVADGSAENFLQTGETPWSSAVNKVYARLRINSMPSATDMIEYECSVHGAAMAGQVRIAPAAEPEIDESHSAKR